MYQYEDDTPSNISAVGFGLNPGVGRIVKFEWINNAGTGGTEGEALDIQIAIEGQDRPISKRMFPIQKAFLPNNGGETTDPTNPVFKKVVSEFNAVIVHIMHCFVSEENLKVALGEPVANFKEFCKILVSLLPKDFEKIPLDIFAQYQWAIKGDAKMTYLEFPKKMSYGRWICKAVTPVQPDGTLGSWKEVRAINPTTSTPNALKYIDEAGNVHPFIRNGWFMNSNFAIQQKEETSDIPDGGGYSPSDTQTGPASNAAAPTGDGTAATW